MRPALPPRRVRRHHLHGLRSGTRQPHPIPGARPPRLSDLILAVLGVTLLGALALVLAAEFTRRALAP
ncbi:MULTISPECIES: hypothetical protein [unclassified Methylobacterium]|uniref:hypothetical protein n=1 Tax=unclassified Methylobacterium TaxID=2615210 RepID=UPI0007020003|nr:MULTISPECIES: hypothetical protein [unclassified Methylobacterium]KQO71421.1 hypothetical protein ASF20_16940 [Methylobacterium sp. Leaf88]KQU16016.1 hypothetical protein ASG63_11485 [Methylobacterium sp. Leaf94]